MGRRNDLGEWDRSCLQCGQVFFYNQAAGNSPDYCSNACRQRAYRQRQRRGNISLEIKTRINVTTQEVTLTLNGSKFLLTVEESEVLVERLLKARALLTATQTTF